MNRKSLIKLCDNLTKQVVFAMYGNKCMCCPSKATNLAHIIGRRHLRHRWRIYNVLCLCRKHHIWFDEHSTECERKAWLATKYPEYLDYWETASVTEGATVPVSFIEQTRSDLEQILVSIRNAKGGVL